MSVATIYLASASPRRREILAQLGIPHEVIPQDVDETPLPGESAGDMVARLAREKARSALASLPDADRALVLGADTAVVCGDTMLGKPANAGEAADMLGLLSGRDHRVITAVALASRSGAEVLLSESTVTFRQLRQGEIDAYVRTGEADDKAGAYGIQGRGALFVTGITGSYSNIVGLPVAETAELLARAGISTEMILDGMP